jgi:hypothetical protein
VARVEVLILSKHGTGHSRRQRGSQVPKRMVSDVISLSAVRVRLRQLVRAETIGAGRCFDVGALEFGALADRDANFATSGIVIGLGYFLPGMAPAYWGTHSFGPT